MDFRLATARFDDQSCTDSPASGAAVGLATIPETLILSLGRAMVGVIDVIAIHGRARAVSLAATATAGPPGAAAAGTASSSPPLAAAASAASRSPRRLRCCR